MKTIVALTLVFVTALVCAQNYPKSAELWWYAGDSTCSDGVMSTSRLHKGDCVNLCTVMVNPGTYCPSLLFGGCNEDTGIITQTFYNDTSDCSGTASGPQQFEGGTCQYLSDWSGNVLGYFNLEPSTEASSSSFGG